MNEDFLRSFKNILCPESWHQTSLESGGELKRNHRRAPLNMTTSRSYKISSAPIVRENLPRRGGRGGTRNRTISCQYFHTDEAFQATSAGERRDFHEELTNWTTRRISITMDMCHWVQLSTGYLTTLWQMRELSSEWEKDVVVGYVMIIFYEAWICGWIHERGYWEVNEIVNKWIK